MCLYLYRQLLYIKMKKQLLATVCMASMFLPSQAQEAWTLQSCIDYAIKHNIQIQKNRMAEEQAAVTLSQYKGQLFPSLSFSTNQSLGYRPFEESTAIVQNGQVTTTSNKVTYQGSYGLSANWTVWNGGINYKNVKAQELQSEIQSLTTEASELSIRERIALLYVQILYTQEAKKVNDQLMQTAQNQYDRGVEFFNQGQFSKADVAQLESQLSNSRYNAVNSETQVINYKRQLKALLELDLSTPFEVATVTPADEDVLALVPSAQEVYDKALLTRPEILSAEKSIDAADMQLDIAKRGYLPTIGLTASLNDSHFSASNKNYGKQLKTNLNMAAGVNISVPIFDNRRNQSAVRQAKIRQANSRLDLQEQKNTLSSTIEQYWIDAYRSQQNFVAAKQQVNSQTVSYELLDEQFKAGLKNIVELLTARDNLLSAEQRMLEAKYTTLLNIQLLKLYTGEEIRL